MAVLRPRCLGPVRNQDPVSTSYGGHYGIYVISDTQILVAVLRQTT
jgi:hypothetical protein